METPEQLVRSKLTEMEVTKMREYVAANPGLGEEMEGLRSGLYASVKKSLRDEWLAIAEKEKKGIDKELEKLENRKFKDTFIEILIASNAIRKYAMDGIIGNLDAEIEKEVMGDADIREVADAISLDVVYQCAEQRYAGALLEKDGMLVEKLAELLERKGPDYAFQSETINAVKRQVIPSLDDYRKHRENKRKWAESSIETMCSELGAKFDAAAGQTRNEAEKSMLKTKGAVITRTLRSYLGLLAKVVDEQREQEIKETYRLDLERERVLRAAIDANRAAYSGK